MALSPYRNSNDSYFRNRSSSFSTPTSSGFVYQEMVAVGDNALVKSYSCGQVFKRDKQGRTFQSTQIQVFNFVSPIKNLKKINSRCDGGRCWTTPKPLKVRSSEGSGLGGRQVKAKLALKFTDPSDETVKSGNNLKLLESQKSNSDLRLKLLRSALFSLFIVLSALIMNHFSKVEDCDQQWNVQDVMDKLHQTVFGQEAALMKLDSILSEFVSGNNSLLVSFSGSTGVGKTYVSSIIFNEFPWKLNKHILFFDLNAEKQLSGKRYTSCGGNLIIVDGISLSDAEEALAVVNGLMGSLKNNEKLLSILIFKTQNNSDVFSEIKNSSLSNVHYHSIFFKTLEKNEIRLCFKAELKRQQKQISDECLEQMVNRNMNFCEISKSYLNCKNVFHEVSLLGGNVQQC